MGGRELELEPCRSETDRVAAGAANMLVNVIPTAERHPHRRGAPLITDSIAREAVVEAVQR
jgi:hypothetical protein